MAGQQCKLKKNQSWGRYLQTIPFRNNPYVKSTVPNRHEEIDKLIRKVDARYRFLFPVVDRSNAEHRIPSAQGMCSMSSIHLRCGAIAGEIHFCYRYWGMQGSQVPCGSVIMVQCMGDNKRPHFCKSLSPSDILHPWNRYSRKMCNICQEYHYYENYTQLSLDLYSTWIGKVKESDQPAIFIQDYHRETLKGMFYKEISCVSPLLRTYQPAPTELSENSTKFDKFVYMITNKVPCQRPAVNLQCRGGNQHSCGTNTAGNTCNSVSIVRCLGSTSSPHFCTELAPADVLHPFHAVFDACVKCHRSHGGIKCHEVGMESYMTWYENFSPKNKEMKTLYPTSAQESDLQEWLRHHNLRQVSAQCKSYPKAGVPLPPIPSHDELYYLEPLCNLQLNEPHYMEPVKDESDYLEPLKSEHSYLPVLSVESDSYLDMSGAMASNKCGGAQAALTIVRDDVVHGTRQQQTGGEMGVDETELPVCYKDALDIACGARRGDRHYCWRQLEHPNMVHDLKMQFWCGNEVKVPCFGNNRDHAHYCFYERCLDPKHPYNVSVKISQMDENPEVHRLKWMVLTSKFHPCHLTSTQKKFLDNPDHPGLNPELSCKKYQERTRLSTKATNFVYVNGSTLPITLFMKLNIPIMNVNVACLNPAIGVKCLASGDENHFCSGSEIRHGNVACQNVVHVPCLAKYMDYHSCAFISPVDPKHPWNRNLPFCLDCNFFHSNAIYCTQMNLPNPAKKMLPNWLSMAKVFGAPLPPSSVQRAFLNGIYDTSDANLVELHKTFHSVYENVPTLQVESDNMLPSIDEHEKE